MWVGDVGGVFLMARVVGSRNWMNPFSRMVVLSLCYESLL